MSASRSSTAKPLSKQEKEEKKAKTAFELKASNLKYLHHLRVDPTLSRLLTATGGTLMIKTIKKEGADVKVSFGDVRSAGHHEVEIEEFTRLLSVSQIVKGILHNATSVAESKEIMHRCASISYYFCDKTKDLDNMNFIPLNLERLGQVKQQIQVLKRLEQNLETAKFIGSQSLIKDPCEEQLITDIHKATHVVAFAIHHLLIGEKSLHEAHTDAALDYCLPVWTFRKLTSEKIDRSKSASSFYFPRRAEKSISLTHNELQYQDMFYANKTLIERARPLINLVCNEKFMKHIFNEFDFNDDKNIEILNRSNWTLPPPIGEIREFLEIKTKVITETIPEPPSSNLRRRLDKLNNALLKAAQLEVLSPRAKEYVIRPFYSSLLVFTTEFPDLMSESIYQRLSEAEDSILNHVQEYLKGLGTFSQNWADIFCLEMRIPLTDPIKEFFREAMSTAHFTKSKSKIETTIDNIETSLKDENLEDKEKNELQYKLEVAIQGLNKLNGSFPYSNYINKINNLEKAQLADKTVTSAKFFSFSFNEHEADSDLLLSPPVRGDQRSTKIDIIYRKLSKTFEMENRLKDENKAEQRSKRQGQAMSALSKTAKQYVKTVSKDENIRKEIKKFLQSFSSEKLQNEAVKKIRAAIDQFDENDVFKEEDSDSDSSDNEEYDD